MNSAKAHVDSTKAHVNTVKAHAETRKAHHTSGKAHALFIIQLHKTREAVTIKDVSTGSTSGSGRIQ